MLFPALAALSLAAAPEPAKPFEFKDGDRVVWLGGTLVEREQRHGYWETALLAANPDKKITVRNLGWSGDTVHAEARGRFDFNNPEKCFRQLVDQTLELKPTVIFVSYGTNESFEGKDGLPKFEKGLGKLLDAFKPAEARVVLFTPVPFAEKYADRNKELARYADVIRTAAAARGLYLADLAAQFPEGLLDLHTDNGMHMTGDGYGFNSDLFLKSLGLAPKASARQLVALAPAVVAKNELFFHRWRPQNETYLFGFRKHEQGRNAKEIAEFDPLVGKAEEDIDRLRKALK